MLVVRKTSSIIMTYLRDVGVVFLCDTKTNLLSILHFSGVRGGHDNAVNRLQDILHIMLTVGGGSSRQFCYKVEYYIIVLKKFF